MENNNGGAAMNELKTACDLEGLVIVDHMHDFITTGMAVSVFTFSDGSRLTVLDGPNGRVTHWTKR